MNKNKTKLFGTDGVRGIANVEPITAETALKLGRAAAYVFKNPDSRSRIVIGKDTRLSCYMLETALVAGLCSMGVDVLLVGPMPTPGVSFLTRSLRAAAGIVISASHNPYHDNGIKFFGADGYKLEKDLEQKIEELISTGEIDDIRPTMTDVGKAYRIDDATGRYIEFAKNTLPKGLTLDGLRIVVDCANGAAYKVAPAILKELGAEVIVYNNEPNGTNINDKCGSTCPETLRKYVIDENADAGISLDGDADRVIMVDEDAMIIDGDQILAIIARYWKDQNLLPNNAVVSTIVGNLGVENALLKYNIKTYRSDVGDRNVIYCMKENGAELGGESCGHIIVHGVTTTGDGVLAALQVLAVMKQTEMSLGKLRKDFPKYPSVSQNIKVIKKPEVKEVIPLYKAFEKYSNELSDKGRIIIRYSGTEPKLRILVEGNDELQINKICKELSKIAKEELGEQII